MTGIMHLNLESEDGVIRGKDAGLASVLRSIIDSSLHPIYRATAHSLKDGGGVKMSRRWRSSDDYCNSPRLASCEVVIKR